ncbi:hypothetical protein Tco_0027721 [Tanacetum coccineum]
MNHQNQFVPKAVLTRTGKIPVNTARTSGTNTVNTDRHNFNSQAVPINAARKVNTVKPIVSNARPKAGFHKSVSPFRKSFNRTTALRTNFLKQKVNTAEVNAVSVVKGKRKTAVKSSAGIIHKELYRTKVLKTSKRRSVFKQGRKTIKSSKGAPTVPTNTEWNYLDMDIDDTMDYTLAQDEGKIDKVDEKG